MEELHRALFDGPLESAHNAVADVMACARCFFELQRRGVIPGREALPHWVEESTADDEGLFDEIYSLADNCPWFDTGMFVDDVHEQLVERGFITEAQREALIRIRDMLEERAG